METTIQGADWSALREHLPLFALLLFSPPPVSFLIIKVLLAANSASKQKVTKQWHISCEQDEAGKSFYFDPDAEHHNSIFDTKPQLASQACRANAVKNARHK